MQDSAVCVRGNVRISCFFFGGQGQTVLFSWVAMPNILLFAGALSDFAGFCFMGGWQCETLLTLLFCVGVAMSVFFVFCVCHLGCPPKTAHHILPYV
jgi:hypothetical protein